MHATYIRIFLVLSLFAVINPSSLLAATEQRIALVIGNSAYSSGPLKNPVNDATDMATMLKKLGFSVTLKKNAGLQEMEEAIESFGNSLKRGGVGLFYYAGHGVQVNGTNYLLPIGAKINKEADVKYQAVDANKILDEMATANNGLNIVMLDACRDNPFARSFRNATRGLAIVSSAPSGTFISYSTSPGNVARDGDGRNSPYTSALLQYMQAPGLTISDVFINVRAKVKKETGQVPWELSSLEGQFYFMPGLDMKSTATIPAGNAEVEREESSTAAKAATEIKRDGRFIVYDNGTVLDTRTNLMWASKDNGEDINWQSAKNYCENYRGGGYTNWRMPKQNELAGLYDARKARPATCDRKIHVTTELIDITCFAPWASETHGSDAAYFDFGIGRWQWIPQSMAYTTRALPVRSGK